MFFFFGFGGLIYSRSRESPTSSQATALHAKVKSQRAEADSANTVVVLLLNAVAILSEDRFLAQST